MQKKKKKFKNYSSEVFRKLLTKTKFLEFQTLLQKLRTPKLESWMIHINVVRGVEEVCVGIK